MTPYEVFLTRHLAQEFLRPEVLTAISSAVLFAIALTQKERLSILERDSFECQFPMYSEARGWYQCGWGSRGESHNLHVHHLDTQRNGGSNSPRNLLTLCKTHHTKVIHPDVYEATLAYRAGDKEAFKKMIVNREKIIADGEEYWNSDWDVAMKDRAAEQTDRATGNGWKMFQRR